ncbi:Dynamin family protein [Geodermatophilus telluris]|uniref:Dynamin family protein n=1 Tax=Geodermatophilus telluris TaxID=1190417 RepID=A0A1G6UB21_9ACTN|nr:dynamin family protein [Geodermatophilus telluris]SDD38513.1 Dynamin family protein [Geodermatophilus telluris]
MTDPGGPAADDVRELLDDALARWADVPPAVRRLAAARRRLDEPLRVAIVGRVKAGKSTLLNALVGARVAPTDAGECTRVVTEYRYGATPRVVLTGTDGATRDLPVRRDGGGLVLDLAGTPPEEVARLVVDWPSADLLAATLVDTPGTGSLSAGTSDRTHAFLGDDGGPAGADAVVHLTRQPQPDDLAVLRAFQEATGATGTLTSTVTVLSRADEVGAGRPDALRAAAEAARRMSADPQLQAVSSAVVPVAGKVALAGRTLRQGDFLALRSLATADPAAVTGLLLSADRFCRPDAPVPLPPEDRVALLDRLGLFGVRLSVALVRAGVQDAVALADELLRRSGLVELQRLLAVQFTARGGPVRTAAALRLLEGVLAEHPVPGAGTVRAGVERIRLAADDLPELALLARTRSSSGPLPPALRAEGERLLGAAGTGPAARLGLPADTPVASLRGAARQALRRWQEVAADPLADRAATDAADVVVRSCEGVLAVLDGDPDGASGGAVPGPGGPQEQRDGRQQEATGRHHQRDAVEVGVARGGALRDVEGEQGR